MKIHRHRPQACKNTKHASGKQNREKHSGLVSHGKDTKPFLYSYNQKHNTLPWRCKKEESQTLSTSATIFHMIWPQFYHFYNETLLWTMRTNSINSILIFFFTQSHYYICYYIYCFDCQVNVCFLFILDWEGRMWPYKFSELLKEELLSKLYFLLTFRHSSGTSSWVMYNQK